MKVANNFLGQSTQLSLLFTLLVNASLVAACAWEDPDRAPPPPRVAPKIDPQLYDMVGSARANLRRRLGLSGNQVIQTISAEIVSWPNSAIGCPKPGHSYTQSIITGSRAEFRYSGTSYYYHGRGLQPLMLCETGARAPLSKHPQPVRRPPPERL